MIISSTNIIIRGNYSLIVLNGISTKMFKLLSYLI